MLGDVEETIYIAEDEEDEEPPRVRVGCTFWGSSNSANERPDYQEAIGNALC